jgi:N-alpha-acetyltransferase 50
MACFPVQYQETYYKDVVERKDEGLCKFAYYNGFVVGAACARVEPLPEDKQDEATKDDVVNSNNNGHKKKKDIALPITKRIYIMTLGVLAPYRGMEIGTQIIQSIFDHYEANKENGEYKDVVEIALHVQISNDDAIKFYTNRFGFERGELVENYYRRIDPPHCYKLFKKLR